MASNMPRAHYRQLFLTRIYKKRRKINLDTDVGHVSLSLFVLRQNWRIQKAFEDAMASNMPRANFRQLFFGSSVSTTECL